MITYSRVLSSREEVEPGEAVRDSIFLRVRAELESDILLAEFSLRNEVVPDSIQTC
jgi:hypothetical protein